MADGKNKAQVSESERRRQRLAAELRSNLIKRKVQARKRSATERGGDGGDQVKKGLEPPQ
jgi:hypothetical protein